MKKLSVFQKHQRKIALDTLQMSDIGARCMGGMTKDEAREFLRGIGFSRTLIGDIEFGILTYGITVKADQVEDKK